MDEIIQYFAKGQIFHVFLINDRSGGDDDLMSFPLSAEVVQFSSRFRSPVRSPDILFRGTFLTHVVSIHTATEETTTVLQEVRFDLASKPRGLRNVTWE
jgi:hypothetical protein